MTYSPNEKDNESFLMSRNNASSVLRVPVTQLYLNVNNKYDFEFQRLSYYIEEGLKNGKMFDDIYDELITNFIPEDIIFSTYKALRNSGKNLQSFLDSTQKTFISVVQNYLGNVYDNATKFQEDYKKWLKTNKIIYQKDISKYNEDSKVFKTINKLDVEHRISPIIVEKTILEMYPKNKNIDFFDIFNNTIVSEFIPYIVLKVNDREYYKIWTGSKKDNISHDYKKIFDKISSDIQNEHIYMILWNGKSITEIENASLKSYEIVTFDLKINKISVKVEKDKDKIIEHVQNAINSKIETINDNKIKGEFFIYPPSKKKTSGSIINKLTFLDFVTADPIMNKFLYYNEVRIPYPVKSRYEFYFREELNNNLYDLDFSTKLSITLLKVTEQMVSAKYVEESGEVKNLIVKNKAVNEDEISVKDSFLQIKITSSSLKDAERYSTLFAKILNYYDNNKRDIISQYKQIIPGTTSGYDDQKLLSNNLRGIVSRGNKKYGSKSQILNQAHPDIFIPGYPRFCSINQPVLVPEEELLFDDDNYLHRWKEYPNEPKSYLFKWKKNPEYDVVAFPRLKPRFYFRCDSEVYKHPHLKINNLPNKDKYEVLPCCAKKNKITNENSNLNKYFRGEKIEKKNYKSNKILETNKFASPGKLGKIPKILETILKKYNEEETEETSFMRSGTIISPNSIIHAVLESIKSVEYLSLREDAKERCAREIRRMMYRQVNISLLKQELYDWSDENIKDEFLNMNNFLDPALFYRALEETFNINIYVFTPTKDDKSVQMEIPRHKIFHTRLFRPDRKTIIIYKHRGSESNDSDYPQCELIGEYEYDSFSKNKEIKISTQKALFNLDMNTYIYELYLKTHNVITWSFNENNELEKRYNLYNSISFKFPNTTHQFLDYYGKMRGLIFNGISIFFPPTQPLNLPEAVTDTREKVEKILKTFNNSFEPVSIAIKDERIVGLWFNLFQNLKNNVYIPIKPISIKSDSNQTYNKIRKLPVGKSHPLISKDKSLVQRLNKMQQTVTIFLQLVIWLFQLFEEEFYKGQTNVENKDKVLKFVNKYFLFHKIDDRTKDTSKLYETGNIPSKLWDVKNTEEALEKIYSLKNNIVVKYQGKYKLYMYNKIFASKIVYNLLEFLKKIPEGRKINHIQNVLKTTRDFKTQDDAILLIDQTDKEKWMQYKNREALQLTNVKTCFKLEYKYEKQPYIFYEKYLNKYYLIQNLKESDFYRVIQTCKNWEEEKINTGYETERIDDISKINFVTYCASNDNNKLELVKNETNGSTKYFEILEYGERIMNKSQISYMDKEYAALLPL